MCLEMREEDSERNSLDKYGDDYYEPDPEQPLAASQLNSFFPPATEKSPSSTPVVAAAGEEVRGRA